MQHQKYCIWHISTMPIELTIKSRNERRMRQHGATSKSTHTQTQTHKIYVYDIRDIIQWLSHYSWFTLFLVFAFPFFLLFFSMKIIGICFVNFKWYQNVQVDLRSNYFIFLRLTQDSMHSSIAFKIRRQKF